MAAPTPLGRNVVVQAYSCPEVSSSSGGQRLLFPHSGSLMLRTPPLPEGRLEVACGRPSLSFPAAR